MNKIKGVVIAIILSIFMNGGIVALWADEPTIDFRWKSYTNSKNDYSKPGLTDYESWEVDAYDKDFNKEGKGKNNNINVWTSDKILKGKENKTLNIFKENTHLRSPWEGKENWVKSVKTLILTIAKEIKNIFFAIASIYLIILVFRLLIAENAEEEFSKTKSWIIWTVIWIIIMQVSFSATSALIGTTVDAWKATSFVANIAQPLLDMVMYVVPFMFMAIAIYSFFKIVTANGDETKIKQWRLSIIHASIAIIVIKVSQAFVNSVYWMINCNQKSSISGQTKCLEKPDVWGITDIFFDLINWVNSFLAIIITVIFIYTWFSLITAAWDKAKMEKARRLLVYIIAWVILIVWSYSVVTFFSANTIQ